MGQRCGRHIRQVLSWNRNKQRYRRQLFKGDLVALANQYQAADAISDFVPDIEVVQGIGKRDVQVAAALKPNDSMEKLYMVVSIQ